MPNITMTYGGSGLVPKPLVKLSKEYQRRGDSATIGTVFKVLLEGSLYASQGGLSSIMAMQDDIRSIFNADGKPFEIVCDDNVLLRAYPRIVGGPNFDTSSNNWVITCPYSVELEFDDEPQPTTGFNVLGEDSGLMPPFISDFQETWNVEFIETPSYYDLGSGDIAATQLSLSHSVSAAGKRRFTGDGLEKQAWEQARNYVIGYLGYNSGFAGASGVLNIGMTGISGFNHMRSNSVDVAAGTFAVTESWVLADVNAYGNAIEDFTIDIRTGIDTDLTTVSIQGTIQGLETRTYGSAPGQFAVSQTKIAAASGYWENVKDNLRIYPRAKQFATAANRPLNLMPTSKSIGYSPYNGAVTYSYEYDDRPSNCVTGSLIESISINDTNPTDVFAEIPIPGRSAGPILQNMSTITSRKRDVSIDVIMAPSIGCDVASWFATSPSTQVNGMIQLFYAELTGSYGQVFKHADNETWEPRTGRYSRNIGWTIGLCN